jgi:hypothetical protein
MEETLKNLCPTEEEEKNLIEPERVKALRAAGFTSAPEVVKYEEIVQAIQDKRRINEGEKRKYLNAFKTLLRARQTYGPDTLLLSYDQFMELCKKHKLVCGGCEEFIGDIPDDKLQEMVTIKSKGRINEIIPLMCVYETIYRVNNDSSDKKVKKEVIEHLKDEFPFIRKYDYDGVVFADGHRGGRGNYRSTFGAVDFKCGDPQTFFMCAPEKMFTERRKMKLTIDRTPKDPILCSLTEHGILLFTRWGEEANDDIIKRYEALGEKISEYQKKLFL